MNIKEVLNALVLYTLCNRITKLYKASTYYSFV